MRLTDAQVKRTAKYLNIDTRKLPVKILKTGMKVELEHGAQDKRTNVTNNDLILTAKITIAHIIEIPDYYDRLAKLEKEAKRYWKGTRKMNPFKKSPTI